MVLQKILKKAVTKARKLAANQLSLGRFLFKQAYKRMGTAILNCRPIPGTTLTKWSHPFTTEMRMKGQRRMLDFFKWAMSLRQTKITDYFQAKNDELPDPLLNID